MSSITVHVPARIAAPRGAFLAATLFRALSAVVERAAAARRARAQARVERLRQTEAAAVRRYAQHMLAVDARFAADLFAAADRHQHERG